MSYVAGYVTKFQSTPPEREESAWACSYVAGYVQFQSPPPAREESAERLNAAADLDISIHSSRAGGVTTLRIMTEESTISIHSSRVGGVRLRSSAILSLRHFNPLLPRGRSLVRRGDLRSGAEFQSTPPPRGRRLFTTSPPFRSSNFNPRPRPRKPARAANFNPRPPRGRRQRILHITNSQPKFQSTPPAREASFSSGSGPFIGSCFNPRPQAEVRHIREYKG